MSTSRSLRFRLFSWFLGAILAASLTSAFVVRATRPEVPNGVDRTARRLADHPNPGTRLDRWRGWRLELALLAVTALMAVMAGHVARRLARPLERLAEAADRWGAGDLAFRTDVARDSGGLAREIRDLASSFNRMADRLEGMVRGQKELLGAVSHELRSPLARARVAVEIARDRSAGAGDASTAAIDRVEIELGVIDTILGDLLSVTRAGLADVRRERQGIVPWLRARLAEQPEPPLVLLEVAADASDLSVPFDNALLARAFHNLLVNARTHGHPADRPIRVVVSRDAGRVRIAVRDEGPGFEPGFEARAFEPFVRADVARPRSGAAAGSGLGLAIVRRIVEAHGGAAFAHNLTGAGASGAEVGFDLPTGS
jgi:signal transduction histidine kinase